MARVGVESFRVGKEFADDRIRQVSCAAHDALLDVPGVRADLQHFQVVIGFQNQKVGFAQVLFNMFGHAPEIGNDRDLFSVRTESVADGVGGIMRNRECGDFDIADYEFNSWANVFDALDFGFRPVAKHFLNFAMRRRGEIRWTFPLAGHLRETIGVVAVLVGDEDAVNFFGARAAQSFEAAQHFFFAEPGVNQEGRAP